MILDLQMPVLDGRAVLAELRRQERPLAVLIVTALEARAVGREFGIPALEKPFDVDVLASTALSLTAHLRQD